MSEQEIRRHFRRTVIVCSLFAVVILIVGFFALRLIRGSWESIASDQMQNEATEIERRIVHQIQKDQRVLQGLSVFLEDYLHDDAEDFNQRLYDANISNSFVTMAYFGKNGIGVLVNPEYGMRKNVNYHSLSPGIQKIVEAAFSGKTSVTSVTDSTVTEQQVFAYATPVYNEDKTEITGVLAASSHAEVFEMLLVGEKVMDGNGSVHMVNTKGDLLISSYNSKDSRTLTSLLYSSYYFDYETQQKIKTALSQKQSLFCPMTYEGREFRVYLYPLDYNDWYIMCVHNMENVSNTALQRSRVLVVMMATLFFVLILMLVYTIQSNWRNTRNLYRIAFEDPLTRADNMSRFMKNLNKELNTGEGFALVALNIHQFKFVNEVLGVSAADDILRYICASLTKLQKKGEFFCRDSADLFYAFLKETDEKTIRWELENMLRDIRQNAVPGKKDYNIRIYAGVFICTNYVDEGLSKEMLITRTRFAMQNAKKAYNGTVYFYDAEIHKKEELENYVENHMQQALETGEFKMYLQPKIDLKTGKLSSAEALVRWITNDGRMIYPDVFIPLFEQNGFCIQLDLYMFEQACRQIRAWMDAGLEPISISVNQSKLLFFDTNYIPNLERMLYEYQVPASMITLEILEGLMLSHADELNQKLRKLRSIGFKISMDDFGSGYSSFNALGSLEIDELKLDRAFLMELSKEKGERFKTIISSIIEMTKNLNISTVAEGVETEENEALIQRMGCDYGQGYFYSRPVSSEEFSGKYMGAK